MKQRKLLYRHPRYEELMNFYNSRQKELQELINRMQSLGIETTMKNLKDLLTGESLQRLMRVEIDPAISALPERLKCRLQDEILTEARNKYNDVIGILPSKLKTIYDTKYVGMISIKKLHEYFEIVDGKVSLSKDKARDIDESYSIYDDTPGRKEAYAACIKFMEAYKEYERAIKEAIIKNPYGIPEVEIFALGWNPEYSLIELENDHTLKLHGEYFKHF